MPRAYRRPAAGAAALLAAALAGCAVAPPALPPTPPAPAATAPLPPPRDAAEAPDRAVARWVAVDWSELPGWLDDRQGEALVALQRACGRPLPAWRALCAELLLAPPEGDAALRAWLAEHLRPYRIESPDGAATGLATGYFEPLVEARRSADATFRVPLHAPPADLPTRRPWYTRQQAETLPAAREALRGREIAWLADPLDALLLQIQGSGRLRLPGADGGATIVRVAYAGHNDQPYRSVGRWLVEQGELRPEEASWPALRDWARRNPERQQEMLWANPRLVFFREEPLPEPTLGPTGAAGVPLLAERSIAVDPRSLPYGTPVWLDTTEPLSQQPLRRLVLALDTGSAIVGAVRADYFWGAGPQAEQQAGRMKQPLRLWALWPRPR